MLIPPAVDIAGPRLVERVKAGVHGVVDVGKGLVRTCHRETKSRLSR
mgnify:CR=1 FL=1